MSSRFRYLSLCMAVGFAVAALRAHDANAVFHCYSVRLHPATLEHLGLEYRLEATTASDTTINDEIGVSDEGPYLHGTTLVFTDPTYFQPLWIACGVEVPDPPDSNWNGISDFFEVDCAVTNLESMGEFELDDGTDVYPGTLELTWNRSAGATAGTCRLRFTLEDFGIDLTFLHDFEIYDYRGTLTYAVEGTRVVGHANLSRLGGTEIVAGSIAFTRVDSYELLYDAFAWTNAVGQAIEFYSSVDTELSLLRGGLRTNYYTVLYTEDGWPDTETDIEYEIWQLHLFDPNDGDQDGVPDLSDDPLPPQPPSLTIRLLDQAVQLEIHAEAGPQATLEQTSNLAPTHWASVQTFTLTNATHTLELTAPVGPVFWRVRID